MTTWEVLGDELSNVGRDTWLIEITGGTGQDCDDCIDYSFYNLTDVFVPALLNGVLPKLSIAPFISRTKLTLSLQLSEIS